MADLSSIAESFIDRHMPSDVKLLALGNSPSDGRGLVTKSYAVILARPGQA